MPVIKMIKIKMTHKMNMTSDCFDLIFFKTMNLNRYVTRK